MASLAIKSGVCFTDFKQKEKLLIRRDGNDMVIMEVQLNHLKKKIHMTWKYIAMYIITIPKLKLSNETKNESDIKTLLH